MKEISPGLFLATNSMQADAVFHRLGPMVGAVPARTITHRPAPAGLQPQCPKPPVQQRAYRKKFKV